MKALEERMHYNYLVQFGCKGPKKSLLREEMMIVDTEGSSTGVGADRPGCKLNFCKETHSMTLDGLAHKHSAFVSFSMEM